MSVGVCVLGKATAAAAAATTWRMRDNLLHARQWVATCCAAAAAVAAAANAAWASCKRLRNERASVDTTWTKSKCAKTTFKIYLDYSTNKMFKNKKKQDTTKSYIVFFFRFFFSFFLCFFFLFSLATSTSLFVCGATWRRLYLRRKSMQSCSAVGRIGRRCHGCSSRSSSGRRLWGRCSR